MDPTNALLPPSDGSEANPASLELPSEINDSEVIYRALSPFYWDAEEDRPHYSAFIDKNGASVDRAGERCHQEVHDFQQKHKKGWGLVHFNAARCRDLDVEPISHPIDGNPHHALLAQPKGFKDGPDQVKRLSTGRAKNLARNCAVFARAEPVPGS